MTETASVSVPETCNRPRPSGPSGRLGVPAPQRRTIGVVARGLIVGLRPSRWHADGLPRGRENQDVARSPREPGSAIVRSVLRCRKVVPAQWRTRHPDGARFSACNGRPRSRIEIRVGGHCGGGLPACPSVTVEVGWAFPRECGVFGCCGPPVAVPDDALIAGLLDRWDAWRPIGPASHHRRGRSWVD